MKDIRKAQHEILAVNGHFERLTIYVRVYGHRIDEAFIYPTETGYELIVAGGYKDDKFTFQHLKEAVTFAEGMIFCHSRSGYLFESEWRTAELRRTAKAYRKHRGIK